MRPSPGTESAPGGGVGAGASPGPGVLPEIRDGLRWGRRWALLAGLFLMVVPLSAGSAERPSLPMVGGARAVTESVDDLATLLRHAGPILQDRNGDGHVDFVHARILVPPSPSASEVAAAANVGARLAFESYGTDLGLLEVGGGPDPGNSRPVVVVGRIPAVLAAAGMDVEEELAALSPGEGLIRHLPPSAGLPSGGVWLAGADGVGLAAAAAHFSAIHPGIQDPSGAGLEEVRDALAEFLVVEGAAPSDLAFRFIRSVVREAGQGIRRLTVEVEARTGEAREALMGRLAEADASDILPAGLHRLDVVVLDDEGGRAERRIRPPEPWPTPSAASPPSRTPDPASLAGLYQVGGFFHDTRGDLLPDLANLFLSVDGTEAPEGVVEMAQRIALETTGIRLPLVRVAERDLPNPDHGFPVLVGARHPVTAELRDAGALRLAGGGAGMGFLELVTLGESEGEGEDQGKGRPALVVSGEDRAGVAAAASLLARRLPNLHAPEPGVSPKGGFMLDELETDLRRFFQARNARGQTALALAKLEQWLDRLEAGERPGPSPSDAPWPPEANPETAPVGEIAVELAVDSVPDGLGPFLEARIRERFPEAAVSVTLHPTGFGAGEEIFAREMELEWEVDELRRWVQAELLPQVAPGRRVRLEARVSEPPEIREALGRELREALEGAGADADAVEVQVLNAYKQGFSWIEDALLPRIRELREGGWGGQAGDRIQITYRHLVDSDEIPWQVVGSETRWLQELFPVEEILARELGIADTAVVFRPSPGAERVYRLQVVDAGGGVLLDESFDPTWVVEPYFHLYPDYERVRIPTGWVQAEVDGESVLDRRVRTDLERFWDEWQGEVLPRLRDYLMDLHEGRLSPGNAPFFDELRVEARLSEPNHRIGVDEEVISSLESLHNDLYFHTLAFLGHVGQHYGVGALNFAGRILPHMDPTGDGLPGQARVSLTGRSRAAPELVVRVAGAGEGSRDEEAERASEAGQAGTSGPARPAARWRYPLTPIPTGEPQVRGIRVAAGEGAGALETVLVEVEAREAEDRFHENRGRADEGAIDRTLLPIPLLEGMVEAVRRLHREGILEDALAFEGVENLMVRFTLEEWGVPAPEGGSAGEAAGAEADLAPGDGGDVAPGARIVRIPVTPRPQGTRHPTLRAEGWTPGPAPIVQWEEPISPAEHDTLLAQLGTFPQVTPYYVARSYLGHPIFAADLLPPMEAERVGQAKLAALRPTLYLSGRQHANEVSSTSHLLRLVELAGTDLEVQELLRGVNIVMDALANPDGAQLAWEMQLVNPDFTHHPGYLGALGMDITAGAGSEDPIYPESQVRPRIMAAWLPDIFLNLHGYPSHEWVQHFSGYAAWVRGRTVTQRTWWAPRGWFIPGFTPVDDPDHPEIGRAQMAILDTMAAAVTRIPEVAAMSERQYARYARYGRQQVDGFREHFHEGMLIYTALRGRRATGSGPTDPRIMTFSATTEAPDETARGAWLDLMAQVGLEHNLAMARYLAGGEHRVRREAEAAGDGAVRRVFRERPVLPPEEEDGPGS